MGEIKSILVAEQNNTLRDRLVEAIEKHSKLEVTQTCASLSEIIHYLRKENRLCIFPAKQ